MTAARTLYTQPRWYVFLLLVPAGVLGVLFGIGVMLTAERIPRPLGVVTAAWFAWTLIVRAPSAGVILTDSEIVNRGHVKTTRIPIANVKAVTMRDSRGRILLHLVGGRRVRLTGVPVTGKHRQRCYNELTQAITNHES